MKKKAIVYVKDTMFSVLGGSSEFPVKYNNTFSTQIDGDFVKEVELTWEEKDKEVTITEADLEGLFRSASLFSNPELQLEIDGIYRSIRLQLFGVLK